MTDSSVTGRNQNQMDIRDESARDNDPLFELSRIFGFEEPAGQPISGQSNSYAPQAEPEFSSEISLERELMIDFGDDFTEEFAAAPVAAPYAEPDHSRSAYQPLHQDQHAHAQQTVEPRFTGYAPLQRAYSEPKPAENTAISEPVFSQEEQHYYAEPTVAPQFEAEIAAGSQYAAYAAPQQDDNLDYFASFEDELHQTLAPAQANTEQSFELSDLMVDDLGFDEIGREPQQSSASQTQVPLSFEDELSFLLHDEAPAAASYSQPAAAQPAHTTSYAEPAYAATSAYQAPQAPVFDEPVIYDEPIVPDADLAPLFDTPATSFAPVASSFDAQDDFVSDGYANNEAATNYAHVEDEFFDAPDLTHLPSRISSTYSDLQEVMEEEAPSPRQDHSFADLFGATSQALFEPAPEAKFEPNTESEFLPDYNSEPSFSEPEQPTENFGFEDDFFAAEPEYTVAQPEITPSVSQNAVRGYSNYTFGAATPAAGTANQSVSNYADIAVPLSYAQTAKPVTAPAEAFDDAGSSYYEEPVAAASEDFFANDDFDFSFEEETPVAEEYSAPVVEEEPELPAYQPSYAAVSKSFSPAPDIEAVAVSENKVEQTQALDLPEVSFGDDAKATGLNSLESEFAEIFSTISVTETSAPDTTSEADKAFENILQDNFADYHASVRADADQAAANNAYGLAAGAAVAGGLAAAAVAGATAANAKQTNATQDDYYNHWAAQGAQTNDFDTYNLGDNFSRDGEEFDDYRPRQENPLRKPILWASVAAVALVVLGGGYYALKSGGVVGGEPAVLRADTQPIKMQPENPGGTVVPNQDKAVYDQVSGNKPASPEQKNLINTEEEPVDMGLLQGQDAEEDRLSDEPDTVDTAIANPQDAQRELIAPRTVKTMVVRADGSIVESSAPAASTNPATTDTGLDEASRLISQSAVPERLGSDKPAAATQSAAAPRVVQTQSFTASGEQVKPREVATAPAVPPRPAQAQAQPQAQAQVQPQAATPEPVANANVPAGTWFIQVASQPSAELAQKNYANLITRYGNIIGGRSVDIKKADIPDKGTYYRVRIPGGTKAEAAALCERLKSAGGSCFPTL